MIDFEYISPSARIVGALYQDPGCANRIFSVVNSDMIDARFRALFDMAYSAHLQSKPIDIFLCRSPHEAGHLAGCICSVVTPYFNLTDIIQAVRQAYKARLSRELGEKMLAAAAPGAAEELIAEYSAKISEIGATEIKSLKDVAIESGSAAQIEARSKSCVKSGYLGYDSQIITQPGDLIILAGRPSMGKTDFALLMAKAIAEKGSAVGFISLEMRSESLLDRLAVSARSWNNPNRFEALSDGAWKLRNLPVYLDDQPRKNLNSVAHSVKEMVGNFGCKVLFLDYLTLLDPPKKENRTQEVAELSRGLKAIAKEFGVPIVVLSQLNRKVEDRSNRRPQMADLRDSGAIEQDADIVLFPYREYYYKIRDNSPDAEEWRNRLELIVGKQRNGAAGFAIDFFYDPEKKLLTEMEFSELLGEKSVTQNVPF